MYAMSGSDRKVLEEKNEKIKSLNDEANKFLATVLDVTCLLQQIETVIEKENTLDNLKVDEVLKLLQEYEETHGDRLK